MGDEQQAGGQDCGGVVSGGFLVVRFFLAEGEVYFSRHLGCRCCTKFVGRAMVTVGQVFSAIHEATAHPTLNTTDIKTHRVCNFLKHGLAHQKLNAHLTGP